MQWDPWLGYVFPVTTPEGAPLAHHQLVHIECPACGGPMPLGLRPIVMAMPPQSQADGGEGDE